MEHLGIDNQTKKMASFTGPCAKKKQQITKQTTPSLKKGLPLSRWAKKNPALLSIESWLFNDRFLITGSLFHGLWNNPHITR